MFLLGLLCIGVGIGVLCRALPVGRQLHALLIDAPARMLAKLSWSKFAASAVLTIFVVVAIAVALNMHDGVIVFMALPEVLAWMAAFDIATLLELSIAVTFAAASVRVGAVIRFVVARLSTLLAPKASRSAGAARERTSKPRKLNGKTTDDDASGPAWTYAFA